MGNIFYFLPGEKQADQETIKKYGLGYILPEKSEKPDQVAITNGPNKQSGVVFTFQDAQGKAHLSIQEKAEWKQIPNSEAWCGLHGDCWPGPQDLVRATQVPGYTVHMPDGQDWMIPAVCDMQGETMFERPLEWDGNEFIFGKISERNKELFDAVSALWEQAEAVQDGGEIKVRLTENAMSCSWGIAVNYRVGPFELGRLEILTTKTYITVMQAMMGIPSLDNIKKKEVLDGPDGIYGAEVEI